MDNSTIIKKIKEQLDRKYPSPADYQPLIADRLGIDIKLVKRRLSGEIQLRVEEVFEIAKTLDLSLDLIYNEQLENNIGELYDYNREPDKFWERIYHLQEKYILGSQSENSSFFLVATQLPVTLWADTDMLRGLFFLMWAHQSGKPHLPTLKEIVGYTQYKKTIGDFSHAMKNMHESHYILSSDMIKNTCDMADFFYQIGIISDDDLTLLSQELHTILHHLEEICGEGKFSTTGKKNSIYLSQKPVVSDFQFIESSYIDIAFLYNMGLFPVTSMAPSMIETCKSWYQSIKRSSSLITCSNEIERYQYFQTHHEYITDRWKNLNTCKNSDRMK